VFDADELTGWCAVRDDGTISVLLAGTVPATGRTVDEIEKEIVAKPRRPDSARIRGSGCRKTQCRNH
jgi:acylphosphatase